MVTQNTKHQNQTIRGRLGVKSTSEDLQQSLREVLWTGGYTNTQNEPKK